MSVHAFLEQESIAFQKLVKDYSVALWMSATTGEKEWDQKAAEAATAYKTYLSDADRFELVKQYVEDAKLDEMTKRQLDIYYRWMAENQLPKESLAEQSKLSMELSSQFNTYRATLDEKQVSENEIRTILQSSVDLELRERAWYASKQIGKEVVDNLLTLVRKRNESARSLGYENYHQMAFEQQELDRDFIFDTFQQLKDLSDEPFRAMKLELDTELAERFGIQVEELRPWHYADPFFQEVPASKEFNLDTHYQGVDLVQLTKDTFTAMGMDIDPIVEKSDLLPREKKNQHAFCIDIDREGDTRVLCNNTESSYWGETMLHEYGHAVYNHYIDRSLPFLTRTYAHILTTEAIAMFYGRMGKNPEWLKRFLGMEEQEVERITPKLQQALRRQMLIAARWIITFVFFERELYENPDQDLNRLWWKLVQEIQGVHPPEIQDEPHWAAKIHFAIAPVYYQNYLLGELTASQLQHYVEKEVSSDLFTTEVGNYFVEQFFKPGAKYHWNDKIEKATGEKLNPRYFVEQFM